MMSLVSNHVTAEHQLGFWWFHVILEVGLSANPSLGTPPLVRILKPQSLYEKDRQMFYEHVGKCDRCAIDLVSTKVIQVSRRAGVIDSICTRAVFLLDERWGGQIKI